MFTWSDHWEIVILQITANLPLLIWTRGKFSADTLAFQGFYASHRVWASENRRVFPLHKITRIPPSPRPGHCRAQQLSSQRPEERKCFFSQYKQHPKQSYKYKLNLDGELRSCLPFSFTYLPKWKVIRRCWHLLTWAKEPPTTPHSSSPPMCRESNIS